MGQTLQKINDKRASQNKPNDISDLNDEQIEELHMLTLLPPAEIKRIRSKFLEIVGTKKKVMSQEEFFTIPAVMHNPLKYRLFKCFDKAEDGSLEFQEFISVMAVFTYHGNRDSKIRNAFKLMDMNDDNRICREDLTTYLKLVTDFGDIEQTEVDKNIEIVVSRTMEESSSDPSFEFLNFDDFVKVITATDFETKLLIEL